MAAYTRPEVDTIPTDMLTWKRGISLSPAYRKRSVDNWRILRTGEIVVFKDELFPPPTDPVIQQ